MSDVKFVDVQGTSTAQESVCSGANVRSDVKVQLKDAVVYYEELLSQNDMMASEASAVINNEAILMGEEIYHRTVEMLDEKKFIECEELLMKDELDEENLYEEVEGSNSSDEYEPEVKTMKVEHIPLEYKIKVVNIAKAHPSWTVKNLQKKGCSRLKRMDDLAKWEAHIKSGGTTFDKYAIINSWTNDRFQEARSNYQQVTTRNLQQWALAAASQFREFEFKASNTWVTQFKRKYGIRQRKITKYVSESEATTMEETWASAENFRAQARALIPNFNSDFVINTDQTGCQYQSTFDRTLAHRGSKVVTVQRQSMNKVTHSYTAQYSLTLSGKLLPAVFVYLQETSDVFGPKVQKLIHEYSGKYQNVIITCSKSGKLTTALYKLFLNNCLRPYVQKQKFLLLVDSWGGQTNPVLYDEVFQNDEGLPTCTLKVIPPKCTPLVQPCDVYFYRQVKNLIKRLQNCSFLIQNKREINSREDCIKIQSIVHHQLSSPIFSNMLQYAWFASKLCDNREIFVNVNEVCFPLDALKKACSCTNAAFIVCARCRKNYCFACFYDKYHPGSCQPDKENVQ